MNGKSKTAIICAALMIVVIAAGQSAQQNSASSENPISFLANYTPPTVGIGDTNNGLNGQANLNKFTAKQILDFSKTMSLYVLAFGLILSLFAGIIAFKTKGWNREITNIFTVIIIVTAGLFLMTAGYSNQQIAPMYGLLGTIVGYLLGKTRPSEDESK